MDKYAIEVSNLSKRYRLGVKEEAADNIGEAVWNVIKAPFKNFSKVRSLSRFNEGEDDSVLWALKDINFNVPHGEVMGVVGKNGAGKSTLLKLLSRITLPTTGEITIRGRVASLLEVGTGFHKELTGRENVYLNGTILGMTKKEVDSKFDEIVEFSGISKFIDTPVKRYSSGMTVRLAFAVAAHLDPEVLIIDEVLAVGDAEFQKKCLGKVGDLSKSGRSILFVSHNMQAVQNLCSQAILLEKGRITAEGDTREVINQYLSRNTNTSNNIQWSAEDAPGTGELSLRQVKVYDPSATNDILFIHSSFNIEVVVDIHTPLPKFNLSLVLNTIKGEVIFNIHSKVSALDKGSYRIKFEVPANLLNDNIYSVDLYFVNASKAFFVKEEAISFELLEEKRDMDWFGEWIGAVRPQVPSTTVKV